MGAGDGGGGIGAECGVELLNVNSATEEELMTLPGINRTTAHNIVEYRKQIGAFKKVSERAQGVNLKAPGCISLVLPRLHKLPNQCYLYEPGNLGNLDNNKEIQPEQVPLPGLSNFANFIGALHNVLGFGDHGKLYHTACDINYIVL